MRALGIDLGSTRLVACLTAEDGEVLGRTVRATGRGTTPSASCHLIREAANELRRKLGLFDVVGVGFPGPVDFSRGMIGRGLMLQGWHSVPLAELLAGMLSVPCVIDNDVNCAAVAELQARGENLPESMLFVSVASGIRGALTIGRQLWRGHTGIAGEIGHVTIDRQGARCWCGRKGCVNLPAHGGAGDAQALGSVLANALNLLNPELVVLGGDAALRGGRWLERLTHSARTEALPEAGCRFELSRVGYEATAVGAALLAIDAFQGLAELERSATAGTTVQLPRLVR